MKRFATAHWRGTLKEGSGYLSTQSQALNKTPYSFGSRFAEGNGTNPEELLAAAHAGCFTMKVSNDLTESGFPPARLETRSVITFENGKITRSELQLSASIPGIDQETFQQIAQKAKQTCPVSVAFSFEISLSANLESS